MKCKKCKSENIIDIKGKCKDMFYATYKNKEYEGYVPYDLNIGSDDYIEFKYCANCGQIFGDFPIEEEYINQYF